MAATQTEGATKAAGTTTKAATSGVKYRCIMQQVVADVAAKQPWFKAAFVTQRPAGRGTTNVLAATEADLTAAREFFAVVLPNLSGKAKQEVGNAYHVSFRAAKAWW